MKTVIAFILGLVIGTSLGKEGVFRIAGTVFTAVQEAYGTPGGPEPLLLPTPKPEAPADDEKALEHTVTPSRSRSRATFIQAKEVVPQEFIEVPTRPIKAAPSELPFDPAKPPCLGATTLFDDTGLYTGTLCELHAEGEPTRLVPLDTKEEN